MSHGSITSTPIIRLGLYQGRLFPVEKHRRFRPERHGFHYLVYVRHPQFLALLAKMRYDADFSCAFVLSDIESNLCDGKRPKTLRGVYLHLDNAPAYNAKKSRQAVARSKTTSAVHLAYPLGAAPCDFAFFGYLEGEMAGSVANSPPNILSEIRRVFQEISKETLVTVYDE
jgi:hypothetical protein